MNLPPESDYLWDRSGRDPAVERLERLLAPFALGPAAAPLKTMRAVAPARHRMRGALALAAAASLLLAVTGWVALQWRIAWPDGSPWPVQAVQGEVWIDGQRLLGAGALPVGATIATADDGVASVRIARIGVAQLGPGTRVQLQRTRRGGHRLRLDEGTLWSRVWAPPAHFGVHLPAAEAIDLGCEFLAHADRDGSGWVSVRSGWVLLDGVGHEVLVPAGARVRLAPGGLPGLPHDERASAGFIAALHDIESIAIPDAIDDARLARLLGAARPADAISLLSLLARAPRLADGPLFDHLQRHWPTLVVDRAAVRAGAPHALEPWWQALPYPRAKRWWLHWRDALPAEAPDVLQAQDMRDG